MKKGYDDGPTRAEVLLNELIEMLRGVRGEEPLQKAVELQRELYGDTPTHD